MQAHPAAEMFPMMVGGDLAALIADIRDHGQREPIIVHEGLILDGRNRLHACQTLNWRQQGQHPEAFPKLEI